ncbi:sigma 54-interacting transcriptional regulator [Polyangium sp. y55x31]|uniref:sigma 54-interacting transcriptional regulator n=1 Tax=Polyangium sp. y55x31 TaxID=3042688 RepID=UPI0024823542|nr:sigma 54-interacting transcriptional regulator [Polyangium sp. y55x31]MDI1484055.1 sigma 54-interacting transcriptional regulator [Polyangium sp. y55x31]
MSTDRLNIDAGFELLIHAGEGIQPHPLPASGRLVLGRAPDVDIRIEDASVSRRHAILHLGRVIRIEDLGSANGVHMRRRSGVEAPLRDTPTLRQRPGELVEWAAGDGLLLGAVPMTLRRRSTHESAPVVESEAMRALVARARRVAQGDFSVLLLGETGVGKEVLARLVHEASPRAARPFVTLNCAALPESLIEGELFGYERGAFSGATQARAGLFEAAEGGTVLLDEIGEMPLGAQARLLRVLEQREVMRIGARIAKPIDVRFLSATNRDLEAEVTRGAFRQDLLFRLNAVTLHIPPLRDRVGEIPRLAEAFLASSFRKLGQPPPSIGSAALARLVGYAFPGNLRELRNAMDHAAAVCEGDVVLPDHLPARIVGMANASPKSGVREVGAALSAIERRRIDEALVRCGGNQTRAAEMLGISRRTLVGRLSAYGMPRPRRKG